MKAIILNHKNIGLIISRLQNIGRRHKSVKFVRNSNNPGTKLGKIRREVNYARVSSLVNSFIDVFTNNKGKILLSINEPSSGTGILLHEGSRFYFVGTNTVIIRVLENSKFSEDAWCKMEFSVDDVEAANMEYGGYWQSVGDGWEYEYGYQGNLSKYTGRYRHSSQRDLIYDPREARGKKHSLAA